MRLAIAFLGVMFLGSATEVLAQSRGQQTYSTYYNFLMENCPGKNLRVKLKNGQKVNGVCHAQLVDRIQITREGVIYDIPYTNIAKMNVRRSWISSCFGKIKGSVLASYYYFAAPIGMALYFNDVL